jgi:hypothetical protein
VPKLEAFPILWMLNISHGLFELWRVARPPLRPPAPAKLWHQEALAMAQAIVRLGEKSPVAG